MSKRCPGFPERSDSPQRQFDILFTRPIFFPAAFAAMVHHIRLSLGLLGKKTRRFITNHCLAGKALNNKRYSIIAEMLQRVLATLSFVSLCLLIYLLTFTSPTNAGPLGLLAIFVSAYLTFVGLISFFLFGMNRLLVMVSHTMKVRRPVRRVPFRHTYYLSTVLAAAPVMLVSLQSVQAVNLYTIILVVLFEVVACLYVTKRLI